jgi:hypothetical protein
MTQIKKPPNAKQSMFSLKQGSSTNIENKKELKLNFINYEKYKNNTPKIFAAAFCSKWK